MNSSTDRQTTCLDQFSPAVLTATLAITTALVGGGREADPPRGFGTIRESALAEARGLNPDYHLYDTRCVCENQTSTDYTECSCTYGVTGVCSACLDGIVYWTGYFLSGSGGGTVQPSGGSGVSCNNLEWYRGVCNANGCGTPVDTGNLCSGNYPPYTTQ